jgi:tryptophanyl-tRNA synthetase
LKRRYETGTVGDVEVKNYLTSVIENVLEPMRERRVQYSESGFVESLIEEGTRRVRIETQETALAMKKAMGLTGAWNRIRRKAERHGAT